MSEVRILRWVAWLALATGVGLAIALWVNSPETVTTTERVTGHGSITFEGVERTVNGSLLAGGVLSLVGGVVLWAVLRALSGIAEDLQALRTSARDEADAVTGR